MDARCEIERCGFVGSLFGLTGLVRTRKNTENGLQSQFFPHSTPISGMAKEGEECPLAFTGFNCMTLVGGGGGLFKTIFCLQIARRTWFFALMVNIDLKTSF